jgi:uncharacterized membrane protein
MSASATGGVLQVEAPAGSTFHLRFHAPNAHLDRVFGGDAFGVRAEAFARFFGTPRFLIAQTILVGVWIAVNAAHVVAFDLYPFILLNLAFSLQAAYAAPLILLAQTRQADRDKAHIEADALHRETLAEDSATRQAATAEQTAGIMVLLEQNTELTRLTRELSERIEHLTTDLHARLVVPGFPPDANPGTSASV